ncbi:MFS general substrate transporter [Clavulina sp. PMI_390]|nr:MFS general substrate transporter [Clavulina sp. PMI_390]
MSATRKAPSLTEACSEITDLEQRSLLPHAPESDQNRAHNQEVAPRVRARTPLPVVALLILLVVRIVEPIGFSQIFPYMNQMIEHLGIAAPEDIGYYSGLVDTCLSFAQLATVYFWSSLSDRIGRKPVVIIGVSGAALSAVCFGFSTSLPAMLASRSIAGALGGNAAVVSSMVGEMTDETNQGIGAALHLELIRRFERLTKFVSLSLHLTRCHMVDWLHSVSERSI